MGFEGNDTPPHNRDSFDLCSSSEGLIKGGRQEDGPIVIEDDGDEIVIEYYDDEDESVLQTIYYVIPGLKARWKSIILAIFLSIVGITFFGVSTFYFLEGDWGYASSMLFLSLLCGLPGGYVCFIIYKVIRQDPDYDLSEIPE